MITDESAELTKLTVNIIPDAMRALDAAAVLNRDSRTDTVNRALILYRLMLDLADMPFSSAEVQLFHGEWHRIRVVRRRWWHRMFSTPFGREIARSEADR